MVSVIQSRCQPCATCSRRFAPLGQSLSTACSRSVERRSIFDRRQHKGHTSSLISVASVGGDAVQGWVDLAKLVSGGGGFKSVYKELAQNIGSDIYIDVNGWHLFLRDVRVGPDLKLNQALAQQIGEESNKGRIDLQDLLKKIPIKIGGGKTQVSLFEAVPSFAFDDLQKIVDDFERD